MSWYPFYRRLGGPQGRARRTENLVPTGIRSLTVQPVVSRYTDWATRPTLDLKYCVIIRTIVRLNWKLYPLIRNLSRFRRNLLTPSSSISTFRAGQTVQGIRKGRTSRSSDEGEAQKVGLSKDGTKWSFGPLGARAVRDNDETPFYVKDWKISDVYGSHNGAYERSSLLGRYALSTSVTDVPTQRKASVSLQNYSDYLPFFNIVRTVHDVKFCLSDQHYMHCNVSTIDTPSPTRFSTYWLLPVLTDIRTPWSWHSRTVETCSILYTYGFHI